MRVAPFRVVYVVVVVLFMVVVFIVKNARKVGLRIWCGKLPVKGPRLEATTLVPESIHALTPRKAVLEKV